MSNIPRAWLKEQRESKELLQEDIAGRCDFSQEYYSQIENGQRRPSVKLAKRIAAVLEFDWTDFFPDQHTQ